MDDDHGIKKCMSTPERKREYIERWLQGRSVIDQDNATPNEQEFTNIHTVGLCITPTSPILGGKRSAKSPIIGSRKLVKRIKVIKKLNTIYDQGTHGSNKELDTSEKPKIQLNFEKRIDEISSISTTISDSNNAGESSSNKKLNKRILLSNTETKNFLVPNFKVPKISEQVSSQLIESVSSEDENSKTTEINVQEINSDTDKTASDLIEEISTQLILESPQKPRKIVLSQNISNPSSDSSEHTSNIHITESAITLSNTNQQFTEIFTPTDQIDSTSTLESKTNYTKTTYIVQPASAKKKKKCAKKGSLLDTVLTSITKEKSNVNLLRHQFHKKSFNISEKPYILLQISEHLAMINDVQLLKCVLIEDSMNLLNNFSINKPHHSVIVLNVPEISGLISDNHKLMLRVYEPFTILDNIELFLHITRFVAIPIVNEKNFSFVNEETCDSDLKVIHEFNCLCIEEKMYSTRCNSKIPDDLCNVAKMLCEF